MGVLIAVAVVGVWGVVLVEREEGREEVLRGWGGMALI